MRRYVALIRKEKRSDYGVEFPDFPGCVTAGATLDEALAMADEALDGHVEVMREHGESIPEPRGLDAVLHDPDLAGAVPVLVPLREKKGRAIPVRITLDEHLLAEIDETAARIGTTRSAFLASAARSDLANFFRRAEKTDKTDKTEKRTQILPSEARSDKKIYVGELGLNNLSSRISLIKKRDGNDKVTDILEQQRFPTPSRMGRAYVTYSTGYPALAIDVEDDFGKTLSVNLQMHSWNAIIEKFGEGGQTPMGKKIIAAIKRLDDSASPRKSRHRERAKRSA